VSLRRIFADLYELARYAFSVVRYARTTSLGIPSGLTENEGRELEALAAEKVVLEIGSWYGSSTIRMARTASAVIAVDWHRGDVHAGYGSSLMIFWRNLLRHGAADRTLPVIGLTSVALPRLADHQFDLVFIDGLHTYDAVRSDMELSLPKLKQGGTLAFHDYGRPEFGVTQAVDELVRSTGASTRFVDSLAVLQLPNTRLTD
jgi:predicted O-methyltransferase YrrM